MQNDFWAKSSGITLFEHTSNVLQAVDVLYRKKLGNFQDEWWLALRYAALLHDLGKIDPNFQEMLKKTEPKFHGTDVPHSILSLFLFKPELFNFDDPSIVHIIISAVAFHHWRDSFPDIFMGSRSYDITNKAGEFTEKRNEWLSRCAKIAKQMEKLAERYQLNKQIIGINETLIEYLRYSTLGAAGVLMPPYSLTFLPESIRTGNEKIEKEKLRIFVAGNLIRADHFASLVENSGGQLRVEDIEQGKPLSAESIDDKIKTLFDCNRYWQKEFFNARPELQKENMILVAPTGFGKTEFAYLWGAGIKNFVLLPMRTATNKIFDRTENLYGEGQVALLHGDAGLELFIRGQRKDKKKNIEETEGEHRKAMELARHLAKPYIVATADQIVPSALRYPGYERILSSLMDSGLVIDEIQAYDPRAAAIVTHLLQQNAFLGGKTLLMTATLPPFIQKEIVKRVELDKRQIVNLLELPGFEEIAGSARHRIQFLAYNDGFDIVINKVVKFAELGKKVIVIMNTVPAACAIYESISNELGKKALQIRKALLHSRFTAERRKELETLVVEQYMPNNNSKDRDPCIVVSTQIVEASLDIDADIMFTEPAPADSLVQRMGRVYRRFARSKGVSVSENANVFIIVEGKMSRKSKHKPKENDVTLGSGIGTVYNRDLTAISLAVLANGFRERAIEEPKYPMLDKEPWKTCFRTRKGRKTKNINLSLYNIIKGLGEKNVLLGEKQKIEWVRQTYEFLDEGSRPDFPLNFGNYIHKYRETLDILDHGYCSDKRRDAMKLFRDVNDITGIPQKMVDCFYDEVYGWIKNNFPKLNYVELATAILPKYLVACPYHSAVSWEGITKYHGLDLEKLIPSEFSINMQASVYGKLERWLSGLVVLELPYDSEKGLNYFDH